MLRALPDYDALFGVDFTPTPTPTPTLPHRPTTVGGHPVMTTTTDADHDRPRADGSPSQLAYLTRVLKTPRSAALGRARRPGPRQNWSHEEYLAAVWNARSPTANRPAP